MKGPKSQRRDGVRRSHDLDDHHVHSDSSDWGVLEDEDVRLAILGGIASDVFDVHSRDRICVVGSLWTCPLTVNTENVLLHSRDLTAFISCLSHRRKNG